MGMTFIETSARSAANVDMAFYLMTSLVISSAITLSDPHYIAGKVIIGDGVEQESYELGGSALSKNQKRVGCCFSGTVCSF